MIYQATRSICDAFDRENLKYDVREQEDRSFVVVGFNGDNSEYQFLFISRDDDNDVSMRLFNLVKISKGEIEKMLDVVTDLNKKYRFMKFVVDEEGLSIDMEFDCLMSFTNPGDVCTEALFRGVRIADEAFAYIMKSRYGSND